MQEYVANENNRSINVIRHEVARLEEFEEGTLKKVEVDDTPVVLAYVDGDVHAVGATCSHWGGPLEDGLLDGHRLMCPWHHACFDVRNGHAVEAPARNHIQSWKVEVEEGVVYVCMAENEGPKQDLQPDDTGRSKASSEMIAVIGAGAAGSAAAEALRDLGYRGRLVILTGDDSAPYDRPNLSKDYLAGEAKPEWIPLRGEEFYDERDIEIWTGDEVISLDPETRHVTLKDGTVLDPEQVLVATGGVARELDVEGKDLSGVHVLRSFNDSKELTDHAESAERVLVVGSGFIGMEAAASLAKRGLQVTVVSPDEEPMERQFGKRIGKMLREVHESNGIQFKLGHTVERFVGSDHVKAVELDNEELVPADLVVVGVGVEPATGFVLDIPKADDGGLIVDDNMRVAPGVWAAGDIARFEDEVTGEPIRVEHWRVAEQQGKLAAHSMVGEPVDFNLVPFFWTRQFDTSIQMVGNPRGHDEVVFDGEPGNGGFLAYYARDGKVRAVAASGRDEQACAAEILLREQRMPSLEAIRKSPPNLVGLVRS